MKCYCKDLEEISKRAIPVTKKEDHFLNGRAAAEELKIEREKNKRARKEVRYKFERLKPLWKDHKDWPTTLGPLKCFDDHVVRVKRTCYRLHRGQQWQEHQDEEKWPTSMKDINNAGWWNTLKWIFGKPQGS